MRFVWGHLLDEADVRRLRSIFKVLHIARGVCWRSRRTSGDVDSRKYVQEDLLEKVRVRCLRSIFLDLHLAKGGVLEIPRLDMFIRENLLEEVRLFAGGGQLENVRFDEGNLRICTLGDFEIISLAEQISFGEACLSGWYLLKEAHLEENGWGYVSQGACWRISTYDMFEFEYADNSGTAHRVRPNDACH